MTDRTQTAIRCPYCDRLFGFPDDLRNHMKTKRKTSAAHGLDSNGLPRGKDDVQRHYEIACRGMEALS